MAGDKTCMYKSIKLVLIIHINKSNLKQKYVDIIKLPWYFDKQGSREICKLVLHYDDIFFVKICIG